MRLFIEFDNQQLSFSTNVEEVYSFMNESFKSMLAPSLEHAAGNLALLRRRNGYLLKTANDLSFDDVAISDLLPLVKDEVRLQFMRSRPDLLWLHAGVVAKSGRALLLAGTSGQGKSTLTTSLSDKGWRFLSDDVAPIKMSDDVVLPFLQTPVRRLHPGRVVTREELGTLQREQVQVRLDALQREPTPIGAVVFISYQNQEGAELQRLDRGSAAMELLRNATNFFDHRAAAVSRAADLTVRIPMYRLAYGTTGGAVSALGDLI
jgi:hypothetical protein